LDAGVGHNEVMRRTSRWFGVWVLMVGSAMGAGQMVVTLVGTGGPELTPEREGMSTLVEAAGQTLLFDAGRGTLEGIYRSRVMPQTVTKVFLTHLHSDHIEGLPGLWMTPWFLLGRKETMEVWGPVGTQAMVDGMRAMYGHDVEHRANPGAPRELLDVTVHEIAAGRVYEAGGVVVTATVVEHADGDPALAYRVEAAGRVAFLTGDCTLTAGLVEAARGADVVVANVAAGTAELEAMARWKPVFAKLLTPEQAARLFKEVKPRLAVYSHVVKKGLAGAAGDEVIMARTRKAGYAGALRMGEDHTRILVGEKVTVERVVGKLPDLDGPGIKF
jgi:ribonuclease Z